MAPVVNSRILFNEIPQGYPEPGKTTVYDASQTIDLETVPLSGGILVKTLCLSIDPYLRGKMRDPSIQTYSAAFVKGEPIYNYGIGLVLRSEVDAVKPGDHIRSSLKFQDYSIVPPSPGQWQLIKNEEKLPWDTYVGVLGMPGITAYAGWKEYAHPQPGDIVFVSGGAGPVGSLVIQLAKAHGLKVIASAGSEEKVEFIRSVGADVAFNYKTEKTADVLAKEGPIDIYWDNVGGETLEAAIGASARGGRIIACGHISGLNGNPHPIRNLGLVVGRELKISGFIVSTLTPKYYDAFHSELPKRVASGEIKYVIDATKGLENAGHAIRDVQIGNNKGKSIVFVAEE